MTRGKLFVIEGTDASGKATQTGMLLERLKLENILSESMSFPRYETPTGRIVAGPYLGKKEFGSCFFPDGSDSVHPEIASLYFAADRRAARDEMLEILESGTHLILDRYVSSNMAHQGGKIEESGKRKEFYGWLDKLEYSFLKLPRPDDTVFLYVPTEKTKLLIQKRGSSDGHESSEVHLTRAGKVYLELVSKYHWNVIECVKGQEMRSKKEIHEEVFEIFKRLINQ